jgi:hypothetical protein
LPAGSEPSDWIEAQRADIGDGVMFGCGGVVEEEFSDALGSVVYHIV